MSRKTVIFGVICLIFCLFFSLLPTQAQTDDWLERVDQGGLNEIGQTVYNESGEPRPLVLVVGTIVRIFLGVLGIIFVILIIVAGFRWMTAGGNEENVKKASAQIKNAVIGLIIILAAWSLTNFVVNQAMEAVINNSIL